SYYSFQTPIAATIEPDADKDGFGDESQDNCPGVVGTDNGCVPKPPDPPAPDPTPPTPPAGDGGGQGQPNQPAPPAPDVVRPLLSSYVLSPASFVAANTGATVVAAKKVGTTVVYKLSEKSTAAFSVQQKVTGVKKGKKCVAGRPGHGKKKCTRTVVIG